MFHGIQTHLDKIFQPGLPDVAAGCVLRVGKDVREKGGRKREMGTDCLDQILLQEEHVREGASRPLVPQAADAAETDRLGA